jgi:KUP system potassium uptake protein
VFPALTLNYLGQAALVLGDPRAIDSPFFLLLPHWSRIPMVVLATVATVIASQAVISGAFSVSRQAAQLGFLPRVTVRHTSTRQVGQIYVPVVNALLLAAVVVLVLGFHSSARLASAYGIAVSGTFVITTLLFLVVARRRWAWPRWALAAAAIAWLPVEVVFLAANLGKIHHGGWLPLAIALVVFTVMTTWHRGRAIVTASRAREEGLLRDFVDGLHEMDPPLPRVPGTAVFPNPSIETTPLALRANVEHNHVLHERVVVIWAQILDIPHVPRAQRITVDDLGDPDDGITHVTARFGFQDEPNLPDALRLARAHGLACDLDTERLSYFVSKMSLTISDGAGMRRWRKRLFVALARDSASPVGYFRLPVERTVTLGSTIRV